MCKEMPAYVNMGPSFFYMHCMHAVKENLGRCFNYSIAKPFLVRSSKRQPFLVPGLNPRLSAGMGKRAVYGPPNPLTRRSPMDRAD